MATRLQLEAERWWGEEMEAPAHAAFNEHLRQHYHHTRAQTGSKGDENHLRGRHRSRDWDLNSRYCTDRGYATTDGRDRRGNGRWLRATDCGIQGEELHAASARLDRAVRAGRLPCVAEWFGTVDGSKVVGWYQGAPGTADDSHLYHLHMGIWTEYCDDRAQLELLAAVITGEDDDMAFTEAEMRRFPWQYAGNPLPAGMSAAAVLAAIYAFSKASAEGAGIDAEELAKIEQAARAGVLGSVDELAAAVVAHLPAGTLTADDVENAVRAAFAGGLAPDA
jgi:hypothetical protein